LTLLANNFECHLQEQDTSREEKKTQQIGQRKALSDAVVELNKRKPDPIYKESYDKLTTDRTLRTSYDKRLICKDTIKLANFAINLRTLKGCLKYIVTLFIT